MISQKNRTSVQMQHSERMMEQFVWQKRVGSSYNVNHIQITGYHDCTLRHSLSFNYTLLTRVVSGRHTLAIPRWKGSHTARAVHNEIAHLCETRMNLMYTRYCHAHGKLFYTPATRGVVNEINARVPRVLHFLCAVLVLGSATCNTENSILIIPVSSCVACVIIVCGGVGQQSTLRVISVWFDMQISWISRKYSQTALETHKPFHPCMYSVPVTTQPGR